MPDNFEQTPATVVRGTDQGLEWHLLYDADSEVTYPVNRNYYDPDDEDPFPISDPGVDPELVITNDGAEIFALTKDTGLTVNVTDSIIGWPYSEEDSLLIPNGQRCEYRLTAVLDGHRVLIALGPLSGI